MEVSHRYANSEYYSRNRVKTRVKQVNQVVLDEFTNETRLATLFQPEA